MNRTGINEKFPPKPLALAAEIAHFHGNMCHTHIRPCNIAYLPHAAILR